MHINPTGFLTGRVFLLVKYFYCFVVEGFECCGSKLMRKLCFLCGKETERYLFAGVLKYKSGKLLLQRYAEHDPHVSYIPKLRYSAFFGTPLDSMLRARGVEEVIVVGVCTDICVLHTVISAVYAGYKVTVPANCCATIIPGGQEWALAHMKGCLGVNVIE